VLTLEKSDVLDPDPKQDWSGLDPDPKPDALSRLYPDPKPDGSARFRVLVSKVAN